MSGDPALRPAPGVLRGERIVVRSLRDEDAASFFEAIDESRDRIREFLPWVGFHRTVEDTLAFIRHTQAQHILRENFHMGIFFPDDRAVGGCGLGVRDWDVPAFEVGYWVRTAEEGKGYVTEAARLVTRCAFEELGAERVHIRCNVRNARSIAVPERLGYRLEGRLRNVERDTSGQLADFFWYAMTGEEYRAGPRSHPTILLRRRISL